MANNVQSDNIYGKLLEFRPEVKTVTIGKSRPREILMGINLFCPSGIMFDLRELVMSKDGLQKVTNANGFLFDSAEIKTVLQGLQELVVYAENNQQELENLHTSMQVKKVRDNRDRQMQTMPGPALISITQPKLKRTRTMDILDASFHENDDDDDLFRSAGIAEYIKAKEKEKQDREDAASAKAKSAGVGGKGVGSESALGDAGSHQDGEEQPNQQQ